MDEFFGFQRGEASTWKYPKVPKSTQKYSKVPKGTQKYRKVSNSTQKYPKVPVSIQKYPKVSTSLVWSVGAWWTSYNRIFCLEEKVFSFVKSWFCCYSRTIFHPHWNVSDESAWGNRSRMTASLAKTLYTTDMFYSPREVSSKCYEHLLKGPSKMDVALRAS